MTIKDFERLVNVMTQGKHNLTDEGKEELRHFKEALKLVKSKTFKVSIKNGELK